MIFTLLRFKSNNNKLEFVIDRYYAFSQSKIVYSKKNQADIKIELTQETDSVNIVIEHYKEFLR